MEKTFQKLMLLFVVVAVFAFSLLIVPLARANEDIGDFDNVPEEKVINDVNSTVTSGLDEGEIKYDQNYTIYSVTAEPKQTSIGNLVTVTAATDNPRVTHVMFVWVNSFGWIKEIEKVSVGFNGSFNIAQNSYEPDTYGRWYVFALFINTQSCRWLYAMRWTCFTVKCQQVIPDFPAVGTAGATAVMLLGFGLFTKKRKQNLI